MLVSRDAEERVQAIVRALSSALSVYLIGRELGQSIPQSMLSAMGIAGGSRMTLLEQAFMAGKLAQAIGARALKEMTEEDVVSWIRENSFTLKEADRAVLSSLRNESERWMQTRSTRWQERYRLSMQGADRDWRATLTTGRFNDAADLSLARNAALQNLMDRLDDENAGFQDDVNKLAQSEMSYFFQQGQVVGETGDQLVYKIPRAEACPICLELHLNDDGSPTMYKLSEVMGNSNVGMPQYAWDFCIGPVHPYSIDGEQRIRLRTGSKKLKEVRPGDEVWTRLGWRKVHAAWKAAYKNAWTLRTKDGYELVLTDEHRVLVRNDERAREGHFEEAAKIVGKWVELPSKLNDEGSPQLNVFLKDSLFPLYWTEEAAYWAAFWTGDGSGNRKAQFYFAHHPQDEQLGVQERLYKLLGEAPKRKSENVVKWYYNDRLTGTALWKLKGRVPEELFSAEKKVRAAYLRGLFDTDGCVTNARGVAQITFVTMKEELALGVQQLLLTLGIRARVGEHGLSGSGDVSYVVEVKRTLSKQRFREWIGFSVPRKKSTLELLGDGATLKPNVDRENSFLDKVVELEPAGMRDVYELMIDGLPEFVANGILVHNCYCMLYFVEKDGAQEANDDLAAARESALGKRAVTQHVEMPVGQVPPHVEVLLKAIRRPY